MDLYGHLHYEELIVQTGLALIPGVDEYEIVSNAMEKGLVPFFFSAD